MANKGLDIVQVKLVMDKTLYGEEQLSSPDQVVQFMRKELSEYDREVSLHFELYNEKPGNQHEYRQHGNDQCVPGNRTGSV